MAEQGWVDPARTPVATYRIQLHAGMGFGEVIDLLDHLVRLGVSHVYLSPVLTAVPGTTHGYDVTDPTAVDPALGGEDGLRALSDAARERGLGLILDCVPNHVATHPTNLAWDALCETGRHGTSARIFDVDWDAPHAHGRVVLPILDAPLGEVLEGGRLTVDTDEDGRPRLRHHEHDLPIGTQAATPEDVLDHAAYLPVHWRATDLVSYRRFFAVNTLAAIRAEDPAVATWALGTIWRLVGEGVADGVRLDHVDGLADPGRLVERTSEMIGGAWLVAEKITAPHEDLPAHWPVAGTSGYETLSDLVHLAVDAAATGTLTDVARAFDAWPEDPPEAVRSAKAMVLESLLAADLDRVARAGWAEVGNQLVEFTERHLRAAIAAVAVELSVYRTYVPLAPRAGDVAAHDQPRADDIAEIRAACDAAATRLSPGAESAALAHLRGALLAGGELCMRFQQLTGPVAAKGVEDTFTYRQHRLVAVNEVGVEPDPLGLDVDAFHAHASARHGRHPAGMATTSTHDTKRGEDVRMRVAALSQRAEVWREAVLGWHRAHDALVRTTPAGPAPDLAARYLLYQTLVGVWPLDGSVPDSVVRGRLHDYLTKALREGAVRTTWHDPDEAYEAGVHAFCDDLLDGTGAAAGFAGELGALMADIGPVAVDLALAQVVLRVLGPGVPDTYQGCEVWEDSLVDPDNRRRPDWERITTMVAAFDDQAPDVGELRASWHDGRIKAWVLRQALRARRARPEAVGATSTYVPLRARGRQGGRIVAFARTAEGGAGEGGAALIAVAPHLPGRVSGGGRPATGDVWAGTSLELPADLAGRRWTDELTGREIDDWSLERVLVDLPVAVLAAGPVA